MAFAQMRSSFRQETQALSLVPKKDSITVRIAKGIGRLAARASQSSASLLQIMGIIGSHFGLYLLAGVGWTALIGGIVLTTGAALREAKVI